MTADANGKHLGGHALAALVHGRDAETDHLVLRNRTYIYGILHQRSVIKIAVASSLVDDVGLRLSGRLKRVFHRSPGNLRLTFFVHDGCQMAHGKGLHHIVRSIAGADKAEDALVDGTAHDKLKARVESPTHIGKILVGEEFEEHRRDHGGGGFVVATVHTLAPTPLGLHQARDIVHNTLIDPIAQSCAGPSRTAIAQLTSLRRCRINGKRSHEFVAWFVASVRVESKGAVNGNAQAFAFRINP